MAYRLAPDEGVREAIVRCAREELDRAVSELSEGIRDDPVRAVHTARKAVKQERSLLRLAQGSMSPKQRRRENAALRGAARALSDARDGDVMIETLTQLSDRFAGQLPEEAFRSVRQELELARDAGREQLVGSALGTRSVQELGAVRLRVDDWQFVSGGWSAIDQGLMRSYRSGSKAFARARTEGSLEDLHAWRKRVKDLWYQQRLLAPICGAAVRGQAKEAHRLADVLGDDHDLGVLRQRLTDGRLDLPIDLDALVRLIDHRRDELQAEAMYIGRRVYAEKPKAFERRMRRLWKAGRAAAKARRDRYPAELAEATRQWNPPDL